MYGICLGGAVGAKFYYVEMHERVFPGKISLIFHDLAWELNSTIDEFS